MVFPEFHCIPRTLFQRIFEMTLNLCVPAAFVSYLITQKIKLQQFHWLIRKKNISVLHKISEFYMIRNPPCDTKNSYHTALLPV